MKYKYWFSTGPVEIEVGDEWVSLLNELDKKERAGSYGEQKKAIHYDAFGFEPDFLGKIEQGIAGMFDESPAFEYAKEKISAKTLEILMRKAVDGESFRKIAKSLGISAASAGYYYSTYSERFAKYYSDGVWIHSPANINFPGIGKVLSIPYKLTPDQVVEIRAYRAMCCSLSDIEKKVGVNRNQILICLMENPVMQTICPACGKLIQQAYRKSMRSFCSHYCYVKWYKHSCGTDQPHRPSSKNRTYLSRQQELILQYYKQFQVSYEEMRRITGIPLRTIIAYFLTNPLPFSICKNCGGKIMGQGDKNKIRLFCSQKCRDAYYNREKYARVYKNIEIYPKPTLPPPKHLSKAIEMRDTGFAYDSIAALTGMSDDEVAALFRYDNADRLEDHRTDMKKYPGVVTGTVRIVNAHIWEPVSIEGLPPLYTVTVIISKDDEKTLKGIGIAIENLFTSGKRKGGELFFDRSRVVLPIHDGDKNSLSHIFGNCFYINASSFEQPHIVDHKIYPITDRDIFGSGSLSRVSLKFFPYWINQKRYGVGCQLGNLQKAYSPDPFIEVPDICFEKFAPDYRLIDLRNGQ